MRLPFRFGESGDGSLILDSFCREFTLSDAPETRVNRAEAFSTIDKMIPFVERLCGGVICEPFGGIDHRVTTGLATIRSESEFSSLAGLI